MADWMDEEDERRAKGPGGSASERPGAGPHAAPWAAARGAGDWVDQEDARRAALGRPWRDPIDEEDERLCAMAAPPSQVFPFPMPAPAGPAARGDWVDQEDARRARLPAAARPYQGDAVDRLEQAAAAALPPLHQVISVSFTPTVGNVNSVPISNVNPTNGTINGQLIGNIDVKYRNHPGLLHQGWVTDMNLDMVGGYYFGDPDLDTYAYLRNIPTTTSQSGTNYQVYGCGYGYSFECDLGGGSSALLFLFGDYLPWCPQAPPGFSLGAHDLMAYSFSTDWRDLRIDFLQGGKIGPSGYLPYFKDDPPGWISGFGGLGGQGQVGYTTLVFPTGSNAARSSEGIPT